MQRQHQHPYLQQQQTANKDTEDEPSQCSRSKDPHTGATTVTELLVMLRHQDAATRPRPTLVLAMPADRDTGVAPPGCSHSKNPHIAATGLLKLKHQDAVTRPTLVLATTATLVVAMTATEILVLHHLGAATAKALTLWNSNSPADITAPRCSDNSNAGTCNDSDRDTCVAPPGCSDNNTDAGNNSNRCVHGFQCNVR